MVDVQADADDGVTEAGCRCAFDGRLDENAAALAVVEHEVVGPADVEFQASDIAHGGCDGEAGGEGDPERALQGKRGAGEDADVESVARGGVPDVASAAAAGGLFVGDVDGAGGGSSGGFGEEERVGGVDGGEVVEESGEACTGERVVDERQVQRGTGCCGTHPAILNASEGADVMIAPMELDVPLRHQTALMLLLALPVACVAWTVTHEEVFREPREFCRRKSEECRRTVQRKFFYLFTCEYCFSHYVAALALAVTQFRMVYAGWRGYVVGWFALIWVANAYMSLFNRLRLDIRHENVAIAVDQEALPEGSPVKKQGKN